MYSINDIANYFLVHCEDVTPKKLQKLCYYAEAWSQALFNRDLINDSEFEAWVHGPVSPALYQTYKDYGWNRIPAPANINFDAIEDPDIELLDSVIATYGEFSGNELEAFTHEEQPWLDARKGYSDDESSDVVISKETMKDYYLSIYDGD